MKQKILNSIYVLVLMLTMAYLFFNDSGILKKLNKQAELDEIQIQIDSEKIKADQLQKEVDSLKNSKVKLEKVAREKYNFRKKNEVIFDVEKK